MAFSAFARRSAASSARREIACPVNGSRIWWHLVERGPASRLRAIRNPPPPATARPTAISSASIALMSGPSLLFLCPDLPGRRRFARRRRRRGAHQALGQRLAQPRQPAPRRRLADEDVGGAPAPSDLGRRLDDVVALLDQQLGAQDRRQPAKRGKLLLLALGHPLLRPLHPQQVEVGSQPLCGAPGSPHQALRASPRADQGQDPLADRLRGVGLDPLLGGFPPRRCSTTRRFDSTSSATWRSATSRSAARFSIRKKLLSAASMFWPG